MGLILKTLEVARQTAAKAASTRIAIAAAMAGPLTGVRTRERSPA